MTEPEQGANSAHRADRPHGSGRPRKPGGPGYGERGQGRDERSGRAPRAGRPPSDPARQAAYEAIAAVHRDDAYANLVLGEVRAAGKKPMPATDWARGLRIQPGEQLQ